MDPIVRDIFRHALTNQLAIIHGFSALLLADAAADDPRRRDFEDIYTAAVTALELLAGVSATDPPARR